MHRRFSQNPTRPERAVQIWLILISAAHNRQALTYRLLADMLNYKGAGVFADTLGHIMFFCREERLPPLSVLVVNQETGLPGEGLTDTDLNADRESVFDFDWYDVVPPTSQELAAAYARGVGR
jgi:hypothetical protein